MVVCIVGCLLFVYISLLISTFEPDSFYSVATSDSFCIIKGKKLINYLNLLQYIYIYILTNNCVYWLTIKSIYSPLFIYSICHILLCNVGIYMDERNELQCDDKIQVINGRYQKINKNKLTYFNKFLFTYNHFFIHLYLGVRIFCQNTWITNASWFMAFKPSDCHC